MTNPDKLPSTCGCAKVRMRKGPCLASMVLFVLILGLTGACNTAASTRPAPTILVTIDAPPLATLPPTWTPLPTEVPASTDTPFPTDTITPTLSAADVCQSFQLIGTPANNAQIAYDGTVTFTWIGLPPGATMTILITLHGARAGLRADASADGVAVVPMLRLPQDGQYDWQLWLQADPSNQQVCTHKGSFIRLPLVMM